MSVHFLADRRTTGIEVASLRMISGVLCACGGVDHLGEQNRGERAVGMAAIRWAGQEIPDLNDEYRSLLRSAGLAPGAIRPVTYPYGLIEGLAA